MCSSSAGERAVRMRTIRDVDVRTIGREYKRHAQLTTTCVLPFAIAPGTTAKAERGAQLFYLPGIGQAVCWKALNGFFPYFLSLSS